MIGFRGFATKKKKKASNLHLCSHSSVSRCSGGRRGRDEKVFFPISPPHSPGTRTASDAQSAARAWSPPPRRRRTERSTAKVCFPSRSSPRLVDIVTFRGALKWVHVRQQHSPTPRRCSHLWEGPPGRKSAIPSSIIAFSKSRQTPAGPRFY